MEEKNLVKVIIPVYKPILNAAEHISVVQCFTVLKDYPIVFVKPYSLKMDFFYKNYGDSFETECFPDFYFSDIKSYNCLMLSSEFYERFLSVQYILIYQTDAFVFSDQLKKWCNKGYDFIGAPWLPKMKYLKYPYCIFIQIKILMYAYLCADNHRLRILYKVGNGGLSLRRPRVFYEIVQNSIPLINYYIEHCHRSEYNEDVFWALEGIKSKYKLNIPSYEEALKFAFDENPDTAFILNNEELPFGAHAWYKAKQIVFWRRFINLM